MKEILFLVGLSLVSPGSRVLGVLLHPDTPVNRSDHHLMHTLSYLSKRSMSHLPDISRHAKFQFPVFAFLIVFACFTCALLIRSVLCLRETISRSLATRPASHLVVHKNTPDHVSVEPSCLFHSGPPSSAPGPAQSLTYCVRLLLGSSLISDTLSYYCVTIHHL